VGQALSASRQCLTDSKELHSLHSYFLKGGNPDIPILYRVRKISITNNFEMHNISAKQNGQTIFSCQASYQRPEASELFHERSMPEAPSPDSLASQEEILERLIIDPRLPEKAKHLLVNALKTPFPIDVREVDPVDVFNQKPRPPRKLVWMKARMPASSPIELDTNMHRCLAAFASDWGLASASLLPFAIMPGSAKLKVANLDSLYESCYSRHSR
jgi:acyl-CoA thioesterase-2